MAASADRVRSEAEPQRSLAGLILHLHPKVVPAEALRLSRTFGLGGLAVVMLLLLASTGTLLLIEYEPAPERAYASVLRIVEEVPLGVFVRNVHHWAANGLLVVSLLHLLRVFYQGAFLPPRRANWLIGMALLALILASAFTGYLLPWDQLAYWAVTVSTGLLEYLPLAGRSLLRAARGGAEVGPSTLARFFALHVAPLPMSILVLAALHFWMVRKAGGILLPRSETERSEQADRSELLFREGVVALVGIATVFLLAAVVDAPLLAEANPGLSPNPAKAPWYFVGAQELLVHLHPTAAALALFCTAALFTLAPYLVAGAEASGRWFQSPSGLRRAIAAAALSAALTPLWVLADERLRGAGTAIRSGLILSIALAAVAATSLVARRSERAGRLERIQGALTFLLVSLLLLTAIGALFRGERMALAWPWSRLQIAAEVPRE